MHCLSLNWTHEQFVSPSYKNREEHLLSKLFFIHPPFYKNLLFLPIMKQLQNTLHILDIPSFSSFTHNVLWGYYFASILHTTASLAIFGNSNTHCFDPNIFYKIYSTVYHIFNFRISKDSTPVPDYSKQLSNSLSHWYHDHTNPAKARICYCIWAVVDLLHLCDDHTIPRKNNLVSNYTSFDPLSVLIIFTQRPQSHHIKVTWQVPGFSGQLLIIQIW